MLGFKQKTIFHIGIILTAISLPAFAKDIVCPGTEISAPAAVCAYLAAPHDFPVPLQTQIRAEIRRSLEWDQLDSAEPLQVLSIGPRLIADLFKSNGWMKGKTPGIAIPLESLFFQGPTKPWSGLDLKNGFGRSSSFAEINEVCTYRGPKKGQGKQPGIKVTCGDQQLKVKFEEVRVQPFVDRIFWALGYGANPCDYHPGLKVAFDEKIFSEFNSRQGPVVQLNLGERKLHEFAANFEYNALDYIASAHLKNGDTISPEELAEKMEAHSVADIDYLTTRPVQIQFEHVPGQTEIGPWSYNDFDHANSRSLRAVGVLSAWLGLFDLRRGNNVLVLDESQPFGLRFIFSDLGSGFGRSKFRLSPLDTNESLRDFKNTVAKRGRIRGAQVNEANDAFTQATAEDFAYGVELISQFSPEQLDVLLTASGYQGDEKKEFLVKLLARRASLQNAF